MEAILLVFALNIFDRLAVLFQKDCYLLPAAPDPSKCLFQGAKVALAKLQKDTFPGTGTMIFVGYLCI